LLTGSHAAFVAGKKLEAEMLLRQAQFFSPVAVAAHPLVYKMQLLNQVLSEAEPLRPHIPPVDPCVIRAYNEILEKAPQCEHAATCETTPPMCEVCPASCKKEKPPGLEVGEEACEREALIAGTAGGPSVCFEKDGDRMRLQVQFGSWTFKVVNDGNGHQSITLTNNVMDKK
jgi:hypothetical protein